MRKQNYITVNEWEDKLTNHQISDVYTQNLSSIYNGIINSFFKNSCFSQIKSNKVTRYLIYIFSQKMWGSLPVSSNESLTVECPFRRLRFLLVFYCLWMPDPLSSLRHDSHSKLYITVIVLLLCPGWWRLLIKSIFLLRLTTTQSKSSILNISLWLFIIQCTAYSCIFCFCLTFVAAACLSLDEI